MGEACPIGCDGTIRVMMLATGGTIDKQYDERDGSLQNRRSLIHKILRKIRTPAVDVTIESLMHIDSLDMTDSHRETIADAVAGVPDEFHAISIIHGTDTMALTGEHLYRRITDPQRPIILTGAMRPYEFRDTDALQNLVECLSACRLAPPGVYVAMHSKLLRFPGVRKDHRNLTFVRSESA